MKIHFLPDKVTTEADPGEPMLEVAERAGVSIPTGCLMGSCHACEVEINGKETICACISGVPDGYEEITVNLYVDPAW
ncbi:MAG: 2Fe-2S iron-sulfur cluster-binding protein [Microcoleaceae cyanobacterium]